MSIKVIEKNVSSLNDIEDDYCLVHFINQKFSVNDNITQMIDEHYEIEQLLSISYPNGYPSQAGCVLTNQKVLSLVVQEKVCGCITLQSLTNSLWSLLDIVQNNGIEKLAIPLSSKMLGGIEQESIKRWIECIFKDTSVEILFITVI